MENNKIKTKRSHHIAIYISLLVAAFLILGIGLDILSAVITGALVGFMVHTLSDWKKLTSKEAIENEAKSPVYKYITTLSVGIVSVLTVVHAFFSVIPWSQAILAVIIYLSLAFFIYNGHKWAIIGAMLMWTGDRWYEIYISDSRYLSIFSFIWWVALMLYLYLALEVRNEKNKLPPF